MSRHPARTAPAIALAALLTLALSGTAQAYRTPSLSTGYGAVTGKVWKIDGRTVGYRLTITDRARDGHCVYVQVNPERNDAPDYGWKRLTRNVCGAGTSRSTLTQRKQVVESYVVPVSGYQVRVCRDIDNRPDECGSTSNSARKGYDTYG